MSKKRYGFWIILVGVLIAVMAIGPDLWAAPGQCPERQTVPTRTPTPPPPPPPTATSSLPTEPPLPTSPSPTSPPHPSTSQLTPLPTTTIGATPAEGIAKPLLPEAGGQNIRPYLGAAMVVSGLFGLLVLVVTRWHA